MLTIKNVLFIGWLILSSVLVICIAEYKGDEWENTIRNSYYNSFLTKDSISAEYKIAVDSLGIPYVNYYKLNGITVGKQYNPTIVSNLAIQYYQEFKGSKDLLAEKRFLNCIQWLIDNLVYTKDYALYKFNWQNPFYPQIETPWTSGISSGLAIESLVYAYMRTHSDKYLETAKYILKGFYVPIERGGFTYQDENGWWFEENADIQAKGSRILDGHIAALLGVYQYYLVTKDDSAYFIFQQGLKALKNNIHLYDAGEDNGSYYDIYKKRADKKYQRIIVSQMKKLYAITHDFLFYGYYKKWSAPLEKSYLIRILKEKNRSGILLIMGLWVPAAITLWVLRKILKWRL